MLVRMAVVVIMWMAMPVFMFVRMVVRMFVVMSVLRPVVRAVRAALGFKGLLGTRHNQVHRFEHFFKHMVGFNLQVISLQLYGHMAVAQVICGPGQIKGTSVVWAGGNF